MSSEEKKTHALVGWGEKKKLGWDMPSSYGKKKKQKSGVGNRTESPSAPMQRGVHRRYTMGGGGGPFGKRNNAENNLGEGWRTVHPTRRGGKKNKRGRG